MSWLDKLAEFLDGPQPARPAVSSMTALPLTANPNDDQKIESAKYRLGAVKRYIEQTPDVPDWKMKEFRTEVRGLALDMMKAGQFTEDDHDAALRMVGIGE